MVNIETPDYLNTIKNSMNGIAKGILRPVARKYDENEH